MEQQKIMRTESPYHVSVYYIHAWEENGHIYQKMSIAEASGFFHLGEGVWYLNRVNVQPETIRGTGVGSALVKELQELLKERKHIRGDVTRLIVEPGGYGSDPIRLNRFYRKAGFTDTEHRGQLQWIVE